MAKRVAVVSALVEGVSIRAAARMVGVSKDTVMKLQRELGEACIRFQDEKLRGLSCKNLQVDEVWSFVYAKQKNVPASLKDEFGVGDVWTFTAIDAETKLVPSFLVGSRDAGCATEFLQDLVGRLSSRVQLTTDGHRMYVSAVEDSFAGNVDYAQVVKIYGAGPEGEHRYSPPECIGCRAEVISGDPDPAHVSTSYVERSHLTVRRSIRRFTRLPNGFSKKVEHHVAALGLFFCFYNFWRIQKTLRCTPAMAAGVTSKLRSTADLVALLPAAPAKKRGPYKPRS
ncbi:MAG TPA: IS1 family transposase [Thermoanaerobaculia bacterium]|nr:IS1 family transposase [Thermoanaerobaculia bacterium]